MFIIVKWEAGVFWAPPFRAVIVNCGGQEFFFFAQIGILWQCWGNPADLLCFPSLLLPSVVFCCVFTEIDKISLLSLLVLETGLPVTELGLKLCTHFLLPPACYMPQLFHPSLFIHPANIRWIIQTMNFHIICFFIIIQLMY